MAIPFKFSPLWIESVGFSEIITTSWAQWVNGSPITIWERKVKRLKADIKEWLKTYNANLSLNVKTAEDNLAKKQAQIENNEVEKVDFQEEIKMFQTYHASLRQEEDMWRLKSRNSWLSSRDRNTKYFHKQEKFREIKMALPKFSMDLNLSTLFMRLRLLQ